MNIELLIFNLRYWDISSQKYFFLLDAGNRLEEDM